MAEQKILNQDEIDALIHGVDQGAVTTEPPPAAPGEARPFDFASQMRIVRGRMPTLEMINERFARLFRISLFSTCCAARPRSRCMPIEMKKFAEYVHSLHVPTSLNLVKILPAARHGPDRARSEARVRGRSTTSSAATAGTPRSKAASSRRPRTASSRWC